MAGPDQNFCLNQRFIKRPAAWSRKIANCGIMMATGGSFMSRESEVPTPADESAAPEKGDWTTLRVITWFSAGMAVAAIGIFLGNELRCRARFKKRTPYDFYSNAGEQQAGEFGMGV
jgi:hypothetical protein